MIIESKPRAQAAAVDVVRRFPIDFTAHVEIFCWLPTNLEKIRRNANVLNEHVIISPVCVEAFIERIVRIEMRVEIIRVVVERVELKMREGVTETEAPFRSGPVTQFARRSKERLA